MSPFEAAERGLVGAVTAHMPTVTLGYRSPAVPAGHPPLEWPAILGDENFDAIADPVTGETSIKVTRTADVATELVLADGITEFQTNAIFILGDEEWTLAEEISVWNTAFVTFGLARQPLTGGNELRRAAV